ncbi:hypothetical protein GCM10023149_01820 [Mucilaginibacter gynuensis]|uniref:histidine kinase n=1 Tax=Mucilaginibacter gynuensis TaxID=1302236 RepID=A0ABP8FPE7_9SPHI
MNLFTDPLVTALLATPVPTLILANDAPDFTVITYNKAYEEATYIKNRSIRGMSYWAAFDPEKAGSYGPTLLIEAFHEAIYAGNTVQMKPLHYNIPSAIVSVGELCWWDIKIVPIVYNGEVTYLLLNVYNITDKVVHQDAIEKAIIKELTLAEDLASSNVKLHTAVEKLALVNYELSLTKSQLEELNQHLENRVFERSKKLFESEAKQRQLIDNAPVAIAVLRGPNHIVEMANKKIVEYWGKTNGVVNKPLSVALPELEGQPFINILDSVRESGVPYINPELCAFLNFNGVYQPRYYDMIYQPVQYTPGLTDSIFIVAVDITDHVNARKKLEQSESMLRLAIEAANIGTWSVSTEEKILKYNPILARIVGWEHERSMTYEEAIGQVTDEYRDTIIKVIEQAIADGSDYEFTYTQKRFNDGRIIRLKAKGRVLSGGTDGERLFSGVVIEIKEDQ